MKQLASGLALLCLSWLSHASSTLMPPMFQSDDPRPWVVMVTQPGCSYCERLEREVLQPLRASQMFADTVRFTAVDIGINPTITDFDGAGIASVDFASRYDGNGTPTLLFLSHQGEVLSAPKFGVPQAIDFYGYAIEQTIIEMLKTNRR